MNAHRIESIVAKDRILLLQDLPFGVGQAVEVIVLVSGETLFSPTAKQGDTAADAWKLASHPALK